MIKFNKANLAVHRLASKDASRYSIEGVQLEKGGTIATDGHVLGVVGLPEQEPDTIIETRIIATSACQQAEKLTSSKNENVTLDDKILRSDKGITELITINNQFPNWRAVMPLYDGVSIAVDADKLKQVADFLGRVAQGKTPAIRMSFDATNPSEKCIRFDCLTESGQSVTALLMPIRDSNIKQHDWSVK